MKSEYESCQKCGSLCSCFKVNALESELAKAREENGRLREAWGLFESKLKEVWGRESDPYAYAYGFVKEAFLAAHDEKHIPNLCHVEPCKEYEGRCISCGKQIGATEWAECTECAPNEKQKIANADWAGALKRLGKRLDEDDEKRKMDRQADCPTCGSICARCSCEATP